MRVRFSRPCRLPHPAPPAVGPFTLRHCLSSGLSSGPSHLAWKEAGLCWLALCGLCGSHDGLSVRSMELAQLHVKVTLLVSASSSARRAPQDGPAIAPQLAPGPTVHASICSALRSLPQIPNLDERAGPGKQSTGGGARGQASRSAGTTSGDACDHQLDTQPWHMSQCGNRPRRLHRPEHGDPGLGGERQMKTSSKAGRARKSPPRSRPLDGSGPPSPLTTRWRHTGTRVRAGPQSPAPMIESGLQSRVSKVWEPVWRCWGDEEELGDGARENARE